MKTIFYISGFIVLTTYNFEYLIARQSNTWLLLLSIILQVLLIIIFIIRPFKHYFKKNENI